ncbi:MAG TPA: LysR family transcriptional regulator [Gammaproteobacteria bacterium]|nr:LysR family transcriptional regulator [Gammaproteobacteria bacterium]
MNLRQFDLNLLVALDVLLQERNVTRAAERLYLSQPAMSGMLSRLRQSFGDELLVRVGRGLEPTEFAAGIAERVHECVQELEELLVSRRPFSPESEKRAFRVGATDYTVLLLFEPLMKRLSEVAPDISVNFVKLELTSGERIAEGVIDFGVFPAQFEPGLPSEPLFEDTWVCAAWEGNSPHGDRLTIEEFLSRPHVSFSISDPGHVSVAQDYLARHGHEHKIIATTESFTAAPFLLHGTALLTIVPRRLGERLRSAAEINLLELPFEVPKLQEKIVWNPRFSSSLAHTWMREQIVDVASAL